MAQPTQSTDIVPLVYFLGACVTFLIGWIYFINAFFKNKKEEKKEWIEQIASASVNAAMDTCLKPIRDDINLLFKYREDDRSHMDKSREDDRRHFDGKFDNLMIEIRK